jgi:hypothetical protein
MMEAVRTSETSVDNHFTRQYNPEDSSEHQTQKTVIFICVLQGNKHGEANRCSLLQARLKN